MAKHWRSFVKEDKPAPQGHAPLRHDLRSTGENTSLEAAAAANANLKALLDEQKALAEKMDALTGKQKPDNKGRPYDHPVKTIGEKQKEAKANARRRQKRARKKGAWPMALPTGPTRKQKDAAPPLPNKTYTKKHGLGFAKPKKANQSTKNGVAFGKKRLFGPYPVPTLATPGVGPATLKPTVHSAITRQKTRRKKDAKRTIKTESLQSRGLAPTKPIPTPPAVPGSHPAMLPALAPPKTTSPTTTPNPMASIKKIVAMPEMPNRREGRHQTAQVIGNLGGKPPAALPLAAKQASAVLSTAMGKPPYFGGRSATRDAPQFAFPGHALADKTGSYPNKVALLYIKALGHQEKTSEKTNRFAGQQTMADIMHNKATMAINAPSLNHPQQNEDKAWAARAFGVGYGKLATGLATIKNAKRGMDAFNAIRKGKGPFSF